MNVKKHLIVPANEYETFLGSYNFHEKNLQSINNNKKRNQTSQSISLKSNSTKSTSPNNGFKSAKRRKPR